MDTTETCTNNATDSATTTTDKLPVESSAHTHIRFDTVNTINTIDVDTALSPACETVWYGNIGR